MGTSRLFVIPVLKCLYKSMPCYVMDMMDGNIGIMHVMYGSADHATGAGDIYVSFF